MPQPPLTWNPNMPMGPQRPTNSPASALPSLPSAPPVTAASGVPSPNMAEISSFAQPMIGGYNSALQSLQKSLDLNNSTYAGGQMRLGTQLQSNLGNVSQMLASRGLGNTTIAATAGQTPYAAYNQGMADLEDQAAQRGMTGYQNLANLQAQGGAALSNFYSPYGQAEYGAQVTSNLDTQRANEAASQSVLQGQIQGGLNAQQNTAQAGLQGSALTAEAQRQQDAQNAAMAQLQQSLANQRQMQVTGLTGQGQLQSQQLAAQEQMQKTGIGANTQAAAVARRNQLQDYQAQQAALEQQRLLAALHASYTAANGTGAGSPAGFTGGITPGGQQQTTYGTGNPSAGYTMQPPAAAGQPGVPTVGDAQFNYDNLLNMFGGDYGSALDYVYGGQ